MTARTLCAFFAHPDDESFSSGGALARYADEGVHVTLVTATSGEAGEIAEGVAVEKQNLAAVRERELAEAVGIIGIHDLRLLRLPDGRLQDHGDELISRYTEILRDLRPQVVITEDIQGITGHPDHVAVTQAIVRAFDAVPDGPLKLYEHVVPLSYFAGRTGLHGTPDDYITTTLDVGAWRGRIAAALRAHGTQVSEATIERITGSDGPWLDYYVCVRSRVPILIPEDDLFAGVPER